MYRRSRSSTIMGLRLAHPELFRAALEAKTRQPALDSYARLRTEMDLLLQLN